MSDKNQSIDQRAFRDVGQLAIWTVVWVATLALAKFGPIYFWDFDPVASWIAVIANLAFGVGWIIAHARYLRGVDELQRKIMLDAIAVALGVGLVGGFAYSAASTALLVSSDVTVAILSVIMAVVYMVAIAIGYLRYR